MHRRSVLASLASAVASGCVGRLGREARESSPTTPTLDDLPCPPARVAPDAAVCSHAVDDAPVVVRATERVAPVDDPGTAFVLANATGDRLRFNPHNPEIYRYTGDGYALVERRSSGTGIVEVPAGETHRWRLVELAVFDRLSPGTFLFAVSVPTAGAMDADRVTCFAPFRLTAGRA